MTEKYTEKKNVASSFDNSLDAKFQKIKELIVQKKYGCKPCEAIMLLEAERMEQHEMNIIAKKKQKLEEKLKMIERILDDINKNLLDAKDPTQEYYVDGTPLKYKTETIEYRLTRVWRKKHENQTHWRTRNTWVYGKTSSRSDKLYVDPEGSFHLI